MVENSGKLKVLFPTFPAILSWSDRLCLKFSIILLLLRREFQTLLFASTVALSISPFKLCCVTESWGSIGELFLNQITVDSAIRLFLFQAKLETEKWLGDLVVSVLNLDWNRTHRFYPASLSLEAHTNHLSLWTKGAEPGIGLEEWMISNKAYFPFMAYPLGH